MKPHYIDEHGQAGSHIVVLLSKPQSPRQEHGPGEGRSRARKRGGAAVRLVEAKATLAANREHVQERPQENPNNDTQTLFGRT